MEEFRARLLAALPVVAVACCAFGAGPVTIQMAEPPPRREASAVPTRLMFSERVLKKYDFEEREVNPEEVPLDWFRAQHLPPERSRLGFPAFNRAAFDDSVAVSGRTSVKLPTRGGSTSLRLGAGSLLMFPDAQYRVSAMVRTSGLSGARGVLQAVMLDEQKRPIEGSLVHSEPVLSESAWEAVTIDLPGGVQAARFLQLELLLLQPEQLAALGSPTGVVMGGTRGGRGSDDIDGAVWFDDVKVLQLPRVSITTGVAGNVFVSPQRPVVTLDVRDLSGQELTAELEVSDIDDTVVLRRSVSIQRGGSTVRAGLDVPRFGWFRVRMRLVGLADVPGTAQTLASTTLLYLRGSDTEAGSGAGASPLRPFALVATGLPVESLAEVPAVAQAVGVPRLTLGISGGERTRRGELTQSLSGVMESLGRYPADLTLAIERLPADLAALARVDPRVVLGLGGVDRAEWEGELAGWIGEVGQRVGAWQLGPVVAQAPLNHGVVVGQLDAVQRALTRVSPSPRTSLAWSADSAWPDFSGNGNPAAAAVTMPASYPVGSIAGALEVMRAAAEGGVEVTYIIEALDRASYSRRDVLDHWLQRACEVWAQSHRMDQALPQARVGLWPGLRAAPDRSLRPDPLLGALSTLARATDGMSAVSELSGVAGVRGFVLAPMSGSAIGSLNIGGGGLIAWSTGEAGEVADITGYFGGGQLVVSDAMGNRAEVPPAPRGGQQTFSVGTTPVFVEGLDPHLVQFLADVRVMPGFVPAVVGSHDCELVLTNPWSTRVSGEVTLISPEAAALRSGSRREATWAVSPTAPIGFTIPAGGSTRVPFTFVFSAAEEAGIKNLGLSIKLAADRAYTPMRLTRPITVGLEDLELTVSAQNSPRAEGPDVVVTASVANTGRLTRTLQLSAMASGFATQSQPVVDIGPGESAVRRFVIRDGAATLSGRRVRMMLADVDGAERMTKYAAVP